MKKYYLVVTWFSFLNIKLLKKSFALKTRIIIILLCISTTYFFSCEEDDGYKSYNENFLTEIIRNGETESLLEYNSSGQVIKKTFYDYVYYLYDYNSSGKLVKISMYHGPERPEYEDELASYDTIIYETDKIIQKQFSDHIVPGNFELSHYFEYLLNSKNECLELITYNNDGAKMEYTTYVWSNGNIKELSWYNRNNFYWKIEYKYDNEYNPYKLLSYQISPNDLTKNNKIKTTITYSNDSVKVYNYYYVYNAYGFPTRQEIISEVGVNYVYEFTYLID